MSATLRLGGIAMPEYIRTKRVLRGPLNWPSNVAFTIAEHPSLKLDPTFETMEAYHG